MAARGEGRTAWVLGAAVAALLALSIFHAPTAAARDVPEAEVRGAEPGTVFRVWPLEGGVRAGYKGYRILYRSTGINDRPIAVSGAVLFPSEGSAKDRPVVAWAHPTTGVVTRCAPTLMPNLSTSIQGLDHFADAGYVVVAPDYEGLGTTGPHPYLIGDSAARTLLDAVRAARTLKDVHAGQRFAVWGHSQGGQTALFTPDEARRYAPELTLVGVAAAAPATKLVDLFEADRATGSGRSLTVMALHSWSRVFGLPVAEFVAKAAMPAFERLANDCIEDLHDILAEADHERALARDFLTKDPTTDARIRAIMERNSTGRLPKGTPVFIAQGTADDLVRPAITRAYAKALCGGGAKVTFHSLPGVSHMTAGRDGAYAAFQWIQRLFRGRAPPSDC